MNRTRFKLTIEANRDPCNREPHVALRQWMKIGLRAFGFRCLTAEEIKPETSTTPPAPGSAEAKP